MFGDHGADVRKWCCVVERASVTLDRMGLDSDSTIY